MTISSLPRSTGCVTNLQISSNGLPTADDIGDQLRTLAHSELLHGCSCFGRKLGNKTDDVQEIRKNKFLKGFELRRLRRDFAETAGSDREDDISIR